MTKKQKECIQYLLETEYSSFIYFIKDGDANLSSKNKEDVLKFFSSSEETPDASLLKVIKKIQHIYISAWLSLREDK